MKDEIAIKLDEGEDLDSIKQYFVNQYGPQVLGEPPRQGFNLLAWVLPVVVILLGGIFVIARGRSMLRAQKPAATVEIPSSNTAGADKATQSEGGNTYVQQLDEELKSYD